MCVFQGKLDISR